jgi:saccharopine dehydrogenase-like NADP-dependent oxidoreductase
MSLGRPEDLLALKVEVEGKLGKKSLLNYRILDYYDPRSKVSAMARTTAYPCTSVALLVGQRKLRSVGVVPPEKIAKDPGHFGFVMSRLRSRHVRVGMPSS